MVVFKPAYFSSLNKETMTYGKKHKITKYGTYNNNTFCAIVM